MQKASFFTASLSAWFFLSALTVFVYRPGIERDLTQRSLFALEKTGVSARVSFSGRDATVEILGDSSEAFSLLAKKARRAVQATFGVRTVETKMAMPVAPKAAPETHSQIEAPAKIEASAPVIAPVHATATTVADSQALAAALAELTLHFHFNSARLMEPSAEQLEKVCALLKQYQAHRVRVVGYTDSSGRKSYNLKLSARRAKAIADFLSTQGIEGARLDTEGRGASRFFADNSSREGRQKNRRVEFEVVG